MNPAAAPSASASEARSSERWRARSARLFEDFRGPARGLLRRAFGRTFADDELEDIYSSAWLGTLHALRNREHQLSDEEIRKYVLTAVAHQASKELRRRRRKPTSPLEGAPEVADHLTISPEDHATKADERSLARELLVTLPPRRRAVMMLRYGWGLDPEQVCGLIDGLSPRAYRKEITRGVDDLTERMRKVETGEWCADREELLKAYAAGVADEDGERQARHHLSNCRSCSEFVGRLTGHLHDLGGGVVIPLALGAQQGGLHERAAELIARLRGAGSPRHHAEDVATAASQTAATRGGGSAGAGILAKLASLGGAGKVAAACLAGGAAAATCAAVGIGPITLSDLGGGSAEAAHHHKHVKSRAAKPAPLTLVRPVPALPANVAPATPAKPQSHPAQPAKVAPASPVVATATPADTEFGTAAAAQPASGGADSGGSSSGSPETSAVGSEFGP